MAGSARSPASARGSGRGAMGAVAGLLAGALLDAAPTAAAPRPAEIALFAAKAPAGRSGIPAAGPAFAVDPAGFRALRLAGAARVRLPLDGLPDLELELAPFDLLRPDAVVTRTDDAGPEPIALDVTLLRGRVAGEPDSWAVLSLSPHGVLGVVETRGGRHVIAPLENAAPEPGGLPLHGIGREGAPASGAARFSCAVDGLARRGIRAAPEADRSARPSSSSRLVCDLAADCDYEFYANRQGSDLGRATSYVLTVLGVVSVIYERDVNVAIRVTYVNVWTTPNDPYSQTTLPDQARQFQDYWNANRGTVSRHAAHLISGRSLGGGYAYLGVLCDRGRAYGVSQLDGFYTYPTTTTTWDAYVLAHEFGHNFDSEHTQSCFWQDHGYAPAGALLDSCYAAEGVCYSGPTGRLPGNRGTIMSYCHTLGPINATIRLDFHPACAAVMRLHAEACLPEGAFEGGMRLAAEPAGPDVVLSWTPSAAAGVSRYDVYRSPSMLDLDPALVGSATGTTFTDPRRIGRGYYRVRAVRAADQSAFSNEASADACLPAALRCFPSGFTVLAPVVADFNEDGISDIAVANGQSAGTVSVLIGRGSGGVWDGTFAPRVTYAAGTRPSGMVAGDFNEDGILDLAVANNTTFGSVSILRGRGSGGVGDGTFGAPTAHPAGMTPAGIVTGDFNEDGITDLAVPNADQNRISVALGRGVDGTGDGTFAAVVPYPVGTGPVAIAAADFDRDGILDLAAVNSGGSTVSILLGRGAGGRGDGTFAPAAGYPCGTDAFAVATGDFDEDGITDLAVANRAEAAVVILRGAGDGTFSAPVAYPAGGSAYAIAGGDFNGDGIADLAVVNSIASGTISLLLGRGTGGFEKPVPLAVGALPLGIAASDVDADGTPDLVVGHSASANNTCVLLASCASGAPTGIRVVAPNGGERWPVESEQAISWTKGRGVVAVDVEVSRDGGTRWERIAAGLTGTRFTWSASGPPTGAALVRVYDPTARGRSDASDGTFTIAPTTLDVAAGPRADPGLGRVFPNPGRGGFSVVLTLAGREPATLEVMDVAGRRVLRRDLADLGPGTHEVVVGEGRLPSGLYLVRLAHGSRAVTAKAAVLD